ncbi:MAG: HEAT repeat domain-containing protein [Nitrospirae bacterium]|nr:HEAT repeat domain-containing protein [Nitrospirota bacterium]
MIKILSHTDERVRKETSKAFAGFRSADTLPHLKNALKDKAPTVRITAARTLGVLKTPPAKKILLDELSAGNFSSADFMEKKELFGALSSWQDDEVKDFLLKTLKRNKFWKKKNDETRACAAFTLGMIGCREAVPILEKTINSKNILLKKHSQAALQQLKV